MLKEREIFFDDLAKVIQSVATKKKAKKNRKLATNKILSQRKFKGQRFVFKSFLEKCEPDIELAILRNNKTFANFCLDFAFYAKSQKSGFLSNRA